MLDYILGTLHLPRGRKPTKYWLDQPIPQTYGAQLLYPFAELPRRRLPSGREAYPLPSCCGRFRRLENDVAVPRGLEPPTFGLGIGCRRPNDGQQALTQPNTFPAYRPESPMDIGPLRAYVVHTG